MMIKTLYLKKKIRNFYQHGAFSIVFEAFVKLKTGNYIIVQKSNVASEVTIVHHVI